MARGMTPRPSAGAAAPSRTPAADQQRQLAAGQRLRQQQYLWEAHHASRRAEAEPEDPEPEAGAAVEPPGRQETEVDRQVARLESILWAGQRRSPEIELDSLVRDPAEPAFDPGPLGAPVPEPDWADFAPRGWSGRWGDKAARERRQVAARSAYQRARDEWQRAEQERAERLAAAERTHAERVARTRADAAAYQDRIARVAAGLRDRHPRVVESFLRTVLRRVPLPPEFPRRAEVTHHPDTEQVTLRLVLPGREVVPDPSRYEAAAALYRRVIAQVALLVVRDVLGAEPHLAGVTFHGLVAVGEPELACLVSFHADRDRLAGLDLAEQPPEECLAELDAQVSSDPYGYRPIAVRVAGPA